MQTRKTLGSQEVKEVWRRGEWAGLWVSDSKEPRQGGRARCTARSPGQTSSSRHPSGLVLCVGSLRCPAKPSTSPCLWKSETPTFQPLCSRRGSLEHLLNSHSKTLADVHHQWGHDQVLKAVAESIASASANAIMFWRRQCPSSKLERKLQGSPHRPWMAAAGWSRKTAEVPPAKHKNTPPETHDHHLRGFKTPDHSDWEGWIEEANDRKCVKYQDLEEESRGHLGFIGAAKRRAIYSASEAIEKAMRWLCIKRVNLWVATGMQVGAWSPSVGSLGWRCLMLWHPKHQMTPRYITDDESQCIQERHDTHYPTWFQLWYQYYWYFHLTTSSFVRSWRKGVGI